MLYILTVADYNRLTGENLSLEKMSYMSTYRMKHMKGYVSGGRMWQLEK